MARLKRAETDAKDAGNRRASASRLKKQTTQHSFAYQKKSYLTLLIVTAVTIVAAAITWTVYDGDSMWGQGQIKRSRPQEVSLAETFVLDYRLVKEERTKMMRLYDYPYSVMGVDKRSKLTLEEYYNVYDGKWPVVIKDVVPKWPAFNWTTQFFLTKYGKERITIRTVDGELSSAVSLAVPLEDFCQHLHQGEPGRWTYLEDELFIAMRPELRKDIGDCDYLDEDMFTLFPEEVRPWNAMLLWGTAHSRSSLHMDPYNWTGTNAVIKGRKRWKLFPPGQDGLLNIIPERRSGFPLDCCKYNSVIDAFNPDSEKYPNFAQAVFITFDQLPGELLIIPTGWYHQAYNMEETLAISSQAMNRNNYRVVLEEIFKANNIDQRRLPTNIASLSMKQQVKVVMDLLPAEILRHGREVTQQAVRHIMLSENGLREEMAGNKNGFN